MANASERVVEPRAFPFVQVNERQHKPRTQGLTEIRGPYYTPLGRHALDDIFETMGEYVDALKFAGGSFSLMPRRALVEIVERCHRSDVLVSTGGFIERVLVQGPDAVDRYIGECRDCGFDIVEISSGFISVPADDWLRLVERVQKAGLKAKPEVGIQFGAGGATRAEESKPKGRATWRGRFSSPAGFSTPAPT
jgi:phosphosulfolactate synthase (CoM biosynthesis protein A)